MKPEILTSKIRALLDVKPGEVGITALAIGTTFFHGVSTVYLSSVSHSLFLAVYEAKHLAYTYIGGAIIVLLVGWAFAALQHRMSQVKLLIGTLTFLLVTLLGARIWLYIGSPRGPAAFLALWTVAYTTLTYMAIWGMFGRIFDTLQAKRLFGLIGAGEFAADVLSGFVTPLLVALMGSINLLYVAGGGLFMSIVFTFLISAASRQNTPQTRSPEPKPAALKIKEVVKSRYPLLLHLLWGLSLMAFYMLDTVFSNALEKHYVDALDPMTSFLGVFFAGGSAVNMIVQTFLTGRILNFIGIIKALFLLPLGVALGCVALFGSQYFTPRVSLTVFILAVGCRMYDYVLRNAIHDLAFQILYQPLPLSRRFAVQSSVLTRAEPTAALVGGLLLLLWQLYFHIDAVNVATGMIVVLTALIGLTFSLKDQYILVLKEALKRRRFGRTEDEWPDSAIPEYLAGFLESRFSGEVIYALDFLEKNAPHHLVVRLESFLSHPSTDVLICVLSQIERLRPQAVLPKVRRIMLDRTADPAVRTAAVLAYAAVDEAGAVDTLTDLLAFSDLRQACLQGLLKHCGVEGILASGNMLLDMINSADPQDRKNAALTLGQAGIPAFYRPLRRLLSDPFLEVRQAALVAAGRLGHPRLMPSLISLLAGSRTRRLAIKAIVGVGEAGLGDLSLAVSKPGQSREILIGCFAAAARLAGSAAEAFLLEHLFHPDVALRSLILAQLAHRNYRPSTAEEISLLKTLLDGEAELVVWLNNGTTVLAGHDDLAILTKALATEFEDSLERILSLLALFCPPNSTRDIGRNLRRPERNKQAYALEMLDSLIPVDMKKKYLPLLDPQDRPARLLKQSRETGLSPERIIMAVAERNRGWLCPWTRATAIYLMGQRPEPGYREVVTAAGTSELPLIKETTAWALDRIMSREYTELGDQNIPQGESMLIIEKALVLGQVDLFSGVPGDSLSELAGAAEELEVEAGETLGMAGELCSAMYVIVSGRVKIHQNDRDLIQLSERQAFGIRYAFDPGERSSSVTVLESGLFLKIEHEALLSLISEDLRLAKTIVRALGRKLGDEVENIPT